MVKCYERFGLKVHCMDTSLDIVFKWCLKRWLWSLYETQNIAQHPGTHLLHTKHRIMHQTGFTNQLPTIIRSKASFSLSRKIGNGFSFCKPWSDACCVMFSKEMTAEQWKKKLSKIVQNWVLLKYLEASMHFYYFSEWCRKTEIFCELIFFASYNTEVLSKVNSGNH